MPILVYDSLITFRYSVHVLARGGGTGLGSGVRLTPLPLAFHYFFRYWPVVYIAFTVTVLETVLCLYTGSGLLNSV